MNEPISAEPLEQVPAAETFSEPVLRQLFPDAPADLAVPKDVGSMFGARLRELRRTHGFSGFVLVGVVVLVAASCFVIGYPIVAIVIAVLLVLGIGGFGFQQHARAADRFFDSYAAARGLTHVENGSVEGGLPMQSKGDKRTYPRVLSGRIAGQDARLAHYTYTEVSTDSEGHRTETDYRFTVLRATLPAQVAVRFAGIYLAPKSISFGALQDKLAHDRKVQLESAEFAKRYSLRVVDEQDDVALYELFSPPFVQRLATDTRVYWEQRRTEIMFWQKGHESEAADLDRLCLDAAVVLQRYFEEWR